MGIRILTVWILAVCMASIAFALPYGAVAQWDYNETSTPFVDNWKGYKSHWQNSLSWSAISPSFNISGNGNPNSSNALAASYGNTDDIFLNESLQANTSSMTWQTWIRQDQSQNGGYFLTDNLLKTSLRLDGSRFQVWAYGGSATSNIFEVKNDVWYFVGLKCKSQSCHAYWGNSSDGSLQNVSVDVGTASMGEQFHTHGRTGTSFGIDGKLDRTQIFNISLSWGAIKSYFNYGFVNITAPVGPPLNGSGTLIDPYRVYHCEEIRNISYNESAHYDIMRDLDCENVTDTHNTGVDFRGFLYGRNHTIKNYYINDTLAPGNTWCGLFKSNGGYIENLIINNFSITCYNPGAPAWTQFASIFGKINRNPEFQNVAVKNSYINARFENAVFGVGVQFFNITSNNTYVYNTIIDPITCNFLSAWHRAGYATKIDRGSDVRYSWVDVDFSCPGNEDGNCFMGRNRGTMIDNYYNNETCNDSCHTSYGAVGIAENMFTDAVNVKWENYSLDKWFFEDGYYPIFAWEYEQQPRPIIYSPNASINANYDDLTVLYYVLDTNSPAVDCDIYLDSVLNQTDSAISPSTNQSFILSDVPDGAHTYYIECTDGVNTRVSTTYNFNVDTTPPTINSFHPVSNGTMWNYSFLVSGNISDSNYLESNYSLFYPNASLLWYSPNATWNKLFNVSPHAGAYTLKISALDTYNNTARTDLFFYVNDTVPPYCFGFPNVSVYSTVAYTWSGVCLDERLMYSFNISCSGADNYNFTEIGINATVYHFGQSNTFPLGNTTCSYEACDGHTREKLQEKWYIRDNKENLLEFEQRNKINKIKTDDDSDFSYKILRDRISFNITFKNKKETSYLIYYETSENSHYYPDPEYIGWIIDYDSRSWFDLNSPDSDFSVIVKPWNKTVWRIEIIPDEIRNAKRTASDTFEFNSIGELNCIEGVQQFSSSVPPKRFSFSVIRPPLTTALTLTLFLLYFIWFALITCTYTLEGKHGGTIQLFNIGQLVVGILILIYVFKTFNGMLALVTGLISIGIFVAKAIADQ